MINNIPGQYFPNKLWMSVDCKMPVIKKGWDHINYVNIKTINDKFLVSIYLSTPNETYGKSILIDSYTYSELIKDEIRNNKKSRAKVEEEIECDVCVEITGESGETINDLVKLLIPPLELAFKNAKINLLKKIRELENEIKSGSVWWL